jgi:CRP/FNR family cyclic AMP-dependent transcriptional regulator
MVATSDLIGYSASNLVLLTFVTKNMRQLRTIAIFSNIAFIAYSALAWLPPVLCLHLVLLPLNLLRLWQVVQSEQRGFPTLSWLSSRLSAVATRREVAPI